MVQNELFGALFWHQNPPEKFTWGPLFLRPFPGNEAHQPFSGTPKSGGVWVGAEVYVENVYELFLLLYPDRLLQGDEALLKPLSTYVLFAQGDFGALPCS